MEVGKVRDGSDRKVIRTEIKYTQRTTIKGKVQ